MKNKSTTILQEGQSYTFRSYFDFPYEADEILAELGYSLQKSRLSLPHSSQPFPQLAELQQRLEDTLLLANLSSETARREALVFPVLLEIARLNRCQIRIEYSLTVNDWLKGNLDYLLQAETGLIVIEAKNDDLTRGFTQLSAEMIALAQAEALPIVYGAVTMGDAWRFGQLIAESKTIHQDITLYRVPDDLPTLTQILLGILQAFPEGEGSQR